MGLRITTWNANSIRLREASLRRIVAEIRPDALCLQEIKVEDDRFPAELCRALGFEHLHVHGQKAYHGVAVLSKVPLAECHTRWWCGIEHSRHAICTLPGGIELHNFYIPAGGDLPDPEVNPKFRHKLDMLAALTDEFGRRRNDGARMVVLGDLNIAPLEHDVWNHKQLLDVVSHTPIETEALETLRQEAGWVDAMRSLRPQPEKVYSWWSYRSPDWQAANKGRRLDHIWVSGDLSGTARSIEVSRETRAWQRPSDHVPVTAVLDL